MFRAAITCALAALVLAVASGGRPAQTPSPVFGINLSMYGPSAPEQYVDDPVVHRQFTRLGVPFIRIPIRDGVSDARLRAVMSSVRAAGATPLVILHGALVADPRGTDLHLLSIVREAFGSRRVYLEIGNEEDNNGISPVAYTQMWNRVVPVLRSRAPASYRFGGPVAYADDLPYITYFVRHARPRPDFISWHEYVCGTMDSDAYCMAHIARWEAHVRRTETQISAAIGHPLPIVISEWNLDPNPDPRYQRPGFIRPWVMQAAAELERLRGQGLMAAMYYTATSNVAELVGPDGRWTPEGAAWRVALEASRPGR